MSQITVFIRHAKRTHATHLDLSNRNLSFIPKQLLSLRSVESLNLSHNKLQYIDSSICELIKLKELDLSYNILTQIPIQISSLPMLKSLKLQGNPLIPAYQVLLEPGNETGIKLVNALKHCFEKQSIQKTPHWLIEGNNQPVTDKSDSFQWDEKIFKVEPKVGISRKTQRMNKKISIQQKQKEAMPQFKNSVLQIKLEDIQIAEQISMGGFSTIHRGRYCGIDVAIKKVFNPNINEELMSQFNNQILMLSRYRHPNIVLLMGATTVPPTLCIVMEYCRQGTLYDLLHRRKTQLNDNERKLITLQIVAAVQFLHKNGIVHRDIKSHNFLVNNYYQVKLCDFGLAKHKSELNTGPMQYSGTPTYMAQELFLKKSYDISVDIFALGTMLYEIYSGEIPYHGIDPADIREKVLKESNLTMKIGMNKAVYQLINRCRVADAESRPNIEQLAKFQQW